MTTTSPESICTNCSHDAVDVYCARCGEKQPHHHDLTVGHFAHEVFHELVHLDSKLFRTLRELVSRPGELTVAYFGGRKARYIAPLRLFLTLFALQFLAYTAYKPVAIYSVDGLAKFDVSGKFSKALDRAAAKKKIPVEQLRERLDHRWQKNMSLLNLVNLAGIALVLKALYLRHKRYLAEHLVFAAHFMCFVYLLSLATFPLYLIFGIGRSTFNFVLMFVSLAILCVYLYFALRRYYGQGGGKAAVKSVVVYGGLLAMNMILMVGSLVMAIVQVLRG